MATPAASTHKSNRDSFESNMKSILIKSIMVCEQKCVKPSDVDTINNY